MTTTVEHKTQLQNWVRAYRPELASRPVAELPTNALLEASVSLRLPVRVLLDLRRGDVREPLAASMPVGFEHCALPETAIDLRETTSFVSRTLHRDDAEQRGALKDLLFRLDMRASAYLDSLVEAVFEAAELLAAGTVARLGYDEEAALSRAYHDANAHLAMVL